MSNRNLLLVMASLVVSSPASVAGQTMITIEAPVKLTDLAPDITKVNLHCTITSQAIVSPNRGSATGTDELPVIAGQLISTFRVIFDFPQGSLSSPLGTTANYSCVLRFKTSTGFNNTSFDNLPPTSPHALKPAPTVVQGTFVW